MKTFPTTFLQKERWRGARGLTLCSFTRLALTLLLSFALSFLLAKPTPVKIKFYGECHHVEVKRETTLKVGDGLTLDKYELRADEFFFYWMVE
jgi:hypothetical protein